MPPRTEEITCEQWKHVPAGTEVKTGFNNRVLTAPNEPGFYTLYRSYYVNSKAHDGWRWEKEE